MHQVRYPYFTILYHKLYYTPYHLITKPHCQYKLCTKYWYSYYIILFLTIVYHLPLYYYSTLSIHTMHQVRYTYYNILYLTLIYQVPLQHYTPLSIHSMHQVIYCYSTILYLSILYQIPL